MSAAKNVVVHQYEKIDPEIAVRLASRFVCVPMPNDATFRTTKKNASVLHGDI